LVKVLSEFAEIEKSLPHAELARKLEELEKKYDHFAPWREHVLHQDDDQETAERIIKAIK